MSSLHRSVASDVEEAGRTGGKLGTRAFPGSTTLYFTVATRADAEGLVQALRELRNSRGPAAGLKAYAFNSDELLRIVNT